ncbi:MAG: putative 2-phosphosulfolactate phosphatase [marine bacterium B5-7]|nr:MAG: putative 2-phosphosulfolactate phosphatase [marine bacterium B5-7]
MQTIHVIGNQQHLDSARLPGKVAVVIDVLFATTTIAMALDGGAREVIAVPEIDEARSFAGEPDTILAGEKDAEIPDGFMTFAPLVLSKTQLSGKRLVLVTTNGTVALKNSEGATHIYTAALVNAAAIARHIVKNHFDETILLVCSASRHRFNIEDYVGAGIIVDYLMRADVNRFQPTDSAIAANTLAKPDRLTGILKDSRVGRMMSEMQLGMDVDFAARLDCYDIVPRFDNTRIVAV